MTERRLSFDDTATGPLGGSGGRGASTRDNLIRAAIRLASGQGIDGVSVRSIAREAGVTEGALYKHFSSKEQLWRDVYGVIVGEMIEEKQEILDSDLSTREAIGEWVRLTYAYYDGNRDAFTYVLLLPHPFAEAMGDEYHAQGRLFERLIRRGHRSGDVDRSMKPGLARAMFVGLLLSVPSQINEGGLKGPASGYAEEVTRAVVRALGVA